MTSHSGFWQGNRKQLPILVAMALLITLNIGPTASTAIRAVEVAMILWCVGFAGWFWRHPSVAAAMATTAVGPDVEVPVPNVAPMVEAAPVPRAATSRIVDADPLSQACRRFGLPAERVAPADEVSEQH